MEDLKKETEWWWIDYLENELDATLEKDLELLLEHSQEDRDSFENFRLLKQWVRESDPAAEYDIEAAATRTHTKIMGAVNRLQSHRPKRIDDSEAHP